MDKQLYLNFGEVSTISAQDLAEFWKQTRENVANTKAIGTSPEVLKAQKELFDTSDQVAAAASKLEEAVDSAKQACAFIGLAVLVTVGTTGNTIVASAMGLAGVIPPIRDPLKAALELDKANKANKEAFDKYQKAVEKSH